MGATVSTRLTPTARTMVFQKYSRDTAPDGVAEGREPESVMLANTDVAENTVTVEWERAIEGTTFFVAKEKVVAVGESPIGDLTPLSFRENDKLWVTATGEMDVHVGLEDPLDKKEK